MMETDDTTGIDIENTSPSNVPAKSDPTEDDMLLHSTTIHYPEDDLVVEIEERIEDMNQSTTIEVETINFADNDLYSLAKYLDRKGFWTKILSESEYTTLAEALVSPETWEYFISQTFEQSPVFVDPKLAASTGIIKSKTAAAISPVLATNFRVRSALFSVMSIKSADNSDGSEAHFSIYRTLEDEYEDWMKEYHPSELPKEEVEEVPKPGETPAKKGDGPEEPGESVEDQSKADKQEESSKGKKSKSSGSSRSNFSSRELKNLLHETATRKWKGNQLQFEGQDELYESLDSVLSKLKNYTEHSYPFLARVRKSDAPDYYDIITQPMDLGTMTKKLYKGMYSSKAEFQNDLNLIFSNCRTYNTDPSSKIYLKHCDAMEKKSKDLMAAVKNIDFSKERSAISASSLFLEAMSSTPSSPLVASPVIPEGGKAKSKKHPKKKAKKELTSSTLLSSEDTSKKEQTPSQISTPQMEPPSLSISQAIEKKIEEDQPPPSEPAQIKTKKDRLQLLEYRHFQRTLPFSERTAFVRSVEQMSSFLEADPLSAQYQPRPKISDITQDLLESTSEIKPTDSEEVDEGFLPEFYHFMGCVPTLPHISPPPENSKDETGTALSNMPLELVMDMLKKSLVQVLASAGYSSIEESALDILVDVAQSYFLKCGKILRINERNYGQSGAALEDVLDVSFKDIGISGGISSVLPKTK